MSHHPKSKASATEHTLSLRGYSLQFLELGRYQEYICKQLEELESSPKEKILGSFYSKYDSQNTHSSSNIIQTSFNSQE